MLACSPSVFAAGLAELQISVAKGTQPQVTTEIRQKIVDTVGSNSKWTLHRALGGKLGRAKNCFTTDCLKLAGKNTGYPAGLRVRFSGEAQIYDWSIEIYDLYKGNLISSQKGACELCGKSEVVRTFSRSLNKGLEKAKLSTKTKTSVKETAPVVKKETKKSVKPVAKKKPPIKEVIEESPKTNLPDVDTMETTVTRRTTGQKTRVLIDVSPSEGQIFLEDKELGTGAVDMELEPGEYNFKFRLEGHRGLNEKILIGEVSNRTLQFRIHLSKTDPESVNLSGNYGVVDELDQRLMWGWIGVGSGAALLITGIVLSSIDGTATCSTGTFQQCPEVYDTGTGSVITTTAGAALLTAGTGLLLWNVLAGEDPDRRTAIVPSLAGKGVSITHSF